MKIKGLELTDTGALRLSHGLFYVILKLDDIRARAARLRSTTGIYHIMLRGIDRRNIFVDDEDRMECIEKLIEVRG